MTLRDDDPRWLSAPPIGFDAVYRCKNHPERDAVAPIACRWCEECAEQAKADYAAQIERDPTWLPEMDRSTRDTPLHQRQFKRKVKA